MNNYWVNLIAWSMQVAVRRSRRCSPSSLSTEGRPRQALVLACGAPRVSCTAPAAAMAEARTNTL